MGQSGLGLYNDAFFAGREETATRSASVVVPFVLGMVASVRSVVDVGCGTGSWLAEFGRCGVPVIKGYDGGPPDLSQLQIPAGCFERTNLADPPAVAMRYDLAICLEVGEHLPAHSAPRLIKFPTDLSDIILFSAALPGQGGVGHINEQPLSYWRALFAQYGYVICDEIRPQVWNDGRIAYWYRQNIVLAVRLGTPVASSFRAMGDRDLVDVVHPELLAQLRMRKQKRKARRLGLAASRVGRTIRTALGFRN